MCEKSVWCLFILLTILLTNANWADGVDAPCELYESSNIENGQKGKDGAIILDGIVYPKKYQFMYMPPMVPFPEGFDNETMPMIEGIDLLLNTTAALIPDYPHLRGCTCKLRKCLRKCCPVGTGLVGKNCEVANDLPEFAPNIYYHRNADLRHHKWDRRWFAVVSGNTCNNGSRFMLEPDQHMSDINYLYLNGSLYVPNYVGPLKFFDHKSYCVDYMQFSNETSWTWGTLMCVNIDMQLETDVIFQIFPVGLIISIIFLILTFLVYLILPELHTIHGKALMHYVGALATAYSFLAVIQISTRSMGDAECISYGMICYVAFILSYFWLNIMSFDIWWAFSGKGGFRGGVREAERKKFLCYLCYAWIGTLIIVSITSAMQFHPSIPDQYSPGFGDHRCWLRDAAMFPYFYFPMLILIVANVCLFAATAFKIFSIKRETKVLRQEGSTRHTSNSKVEDDTQRFWLYVKLFLVMGVNWSMEILSWAVGGSKWLWIATDVFNSIQGLLIFLIFVFKPKIKKLLIRRYYTLRGKAIPPHAATTKSIISSSNVTQMTNVNGKTGINKIDNDSKLEKALLN